MHAHMQVDQRCSITQARLASNRGCVDSTYSCQDECFFQGGDGAFSITLGLCQCSALIDPLALCTGECLNCRPEIGVKRSLNSTLVYTAHDCNGTVISEQEIVGVLGVISLDAENRRSQLVTHTGEGQVLGAFPTTNAQALSLLLSLIARRRRRNAMPTPEITNPVLCLEIGEAILFQITQSANGSYHYPTYVKDHLLNTNTNFDFGAFSQLDTLLRSSVDLSTFVHVFHIPGTYVFSDSQTPGSMTVIIVIESGTTCERDGQDFRVLPLSTATLNQFGVTTLPVINQEPDFPTIFGILATTLLLVTLVVLLVFIWNPQTAGIKTPAALQPIYRRVDEPKVVYIGGDCGLDSLEKRGVGVGAVTAGIGSPDNVLLENFNIRTLYDKLEDQNLHVSAQLSRQQTDLRAFYDQVVQQVEGLKGLVSETSVLSTVEASHNLTHLQNYEQRMEPVGAEQPSEILKSSFVASLGSEQESMLVGMLRELLTKAGYKGHRRSVRKHTEKEEITSTVTAMQEMVRTCVHAGVLLTPYNNYIVNNSAAKHVTLYTIYILQESRHLAEIKASSVLLSDGLSKAASDKEVNRLLEEHEESMAVLHARQKREQMQQKEELKKKLAARRNKKYAGLQVSRACMYMYGIMVQLLIMTQSSYY